MYADLQCCKWLSIQILFTHVIYFITEKARLQQITIIRFNNRHLDETMSWDDSTRKLMFQYHIDIKYHYNHNSLF